MKLERISLANFRGFDQIDLDFASDVTVIAGVNGVGKSGILKSLASMLSRALPQFTPSGEDPLPFADTDVQIGKPSMVMSTVLRLETSHLRIDVSRAAPLTPEKVVLQLKRRDDLRFAIRGTKIGSKEEEKIEDELRMIQLQLDPSDAQIVRFLPFDSNTTPEEFVMSSKLMRAQPLAVCYSTERFLSRLPPNFRKTKAVEIAMAYDKSLNQLEVSQNDFANWYRALKEGERSDMAEIILNQLGAAVNTFLPGLTGLLLHSERQPRFSVEKNGVLFFLEQLSDGERGLLALVFDLTRRLAIANPDSENPIVEGVALVMIDEIELHLHPKWQRQVVRRLRDTFKNCQFVITTHSPQVIGQVKAEKLRLLTVNDLGRVSLVPVSQSFGMDSSWILQNIMGVPARDYEIEQKLSMIYDSIDDGRFLDAREHAEEIRAEVGDFPDLQETFALLDRFELLGGE